MAKADTAKIVDNEEDTAVGPPPAYSNNQRTKNDAAGDENVQMNVVVVNVDTSNSLLRNIDDLYVEQPDVEANNANAMKGIINPDHERLGLLFSEKTIRSAFVRKVYSLLLLMIALALTIILIFTYVKPVRKFLLESNNFVFLLVPALIVYIAGIIIITCCKSLRRTYPWNYVILFMFALALSVLMGVVSAAVGSYEVLISVGITAGICLLVTAFAFQTKYDFTVCSVGICIALFVVLIMGILLGTLPSAKPQNIIYCCLAIIIYSICLVFDTQTIIEGKHRYKISPEEHVFAATTLFLDISIIFLKVLRIFARR